MLHLWWVSVYCNVAVCKKNTEESGEQVIVSKEMGVKTELLL